LDLGKIIVKKATQVSGHFLKLHFCMFKRSQMKYNNLDYHFFGEYFSLMQSLHAQNLTHIKNKLHVQSIQTLKVDNFCFFSNMFFFYQVCTIPFENWRVF
jgi:hypothetical protein